MRTSSERGSDWRGGRLCALLALFLAVFVLPSAFAVTTEVYATNVNSAGTDLRWDRYVPIAGGPAWPAVVLVHVGGYKTGNRGPAGVAQDLANAGFLVFAIEYRLAPPASPMLSAGPPGDPQFSADLATDGRPPNQTNDVKLAVIAARGDAQCNGKVVLVGGSGGAAHSMFVARDGTAGTSQPDVVVCLSPLTDLANQTDLADPLRTQYKGDIYNYLNFANSVPTNDSGYQAAAKAASAFWLGSYATAPPILFFLSTSDTVPVGQYNGMRSKLIADGAVFESILRDTGATAPDSNEHAFGYWNSPTNGSAGTPNVAFPTVKDYVKDFIFRKLAVTAPPLEAPATIVIKRK